MLVWINFNYKGLINQTVESTVQCIVEIENAM